MTDFLDACEKFNRASEEIFESHRRGEDYLIQRKWLLAALKGLFDVADACDVAIDDDVSRIMNLREEHRQSEYSEQALSLD
ncbi:hypothetical protein DESC_190017 [Desulfosarcina cetonica]|uniref:hypothetical protein n=1 Tax=Desulfosarcina cetonica TaxID=90730 RepID=UPI0006D29AB4|nr:hypothetical protein [Desulfosarcina cetonica]VTR64400.1 hypothetical protein DESC_190017 [Desulfosarcina cetonica]